MFHISKGSAPLLTAVCFFVFGFMALAPAGRASVYYLDCNSSGVCGSPSSAIGTVTVTQVGLPSAGVVQIAVSLASGYTFEADSDPAVAFNSSQTGLTIGTFATTPVGGGANWQVMTTGNTIPTDAPALGNFTNLVDDCTTETGCSGAYTAVTFDVSKSGLTPTDFLTTNNKGFTFAAGVSSGGSSSFYGAQGAATPEPSSYAVLIGASLLGLLALRKRFAFRTPTQEASGSGETD